jgi:hypothetical protein
MFCDALGEREGGENAKRSDTQMGNTKYESIGTLLQSALLLNLLQHISQCKISLSLAIAKRNAELGQP